MSDENDRNEALEFLHQLFVEPEPPPPPPNFGIPINTTARITSQGELNVVFATGNAKIPFPPQVKGVLAKRKPHYTIQLAGDDLKGPIKFTVPFPTVDLTEAEIDQLVKESKGRRIARQSGSSARVGLAFSNQRKFTGPGFKRKETVPIPDAMFDPVENAMHGTLPAGFLELGIPQAKKVSEVKSVYVAFTDRKSEAQVPIAESTIGQWVDTPDDRDLDVKLRPGQRRISIKLAPKGKGNSKRIKDPVTRAKYIIPFPDFPNHYIEPGDPRQFSYKCTTFKTKGDGLTIILQKNIRIVPKVEKKREVKEVKSEGNVVSLPKVRSNNE